MPDYSQERIRIDLRPTAETAAALGVTVKELYRRIQRLILESPSEVRQAIQDTIGRNFDQEGNPRWVPLSLMTARRRSKLGFGGKRILQRSGKLRASAIAGVKAKRRGTDEAFIAAEYNPKDPKWVNQFGATFSSSVKDEDGGVTKEAHDIPRREFVPTGHAARELADLIVNKILLPKLQKGS